MKYILGINGGFGGGYQDGCACLYASGKIIAAVEEERLLKIKFAAGRLPLKAIAEVLDLGGITLAEVSAIAFHGISWPLQVENDLRSYFLHHFGSCPEIKRFHHHDAHAASSYFLSGFDEALVITMDNSGDGISSQLMIGKNQNLELIRRWEKPQSFGTFYSCITQLAGFERDADEYKLMGLAPYGDPAAFDLNNFLSYSGEGEYKVNPDFLYPIKAQSSFPNKQIPLYSDALLKNLGLNSGGYLKDEKIKTNLATAAQHQLEKVVTEWISYWVTKTGIKNVCLAGGVAMNCVLNQKILEGCGVEKIFVPPFAGDQGVSIGCAYLAGLMYNVLPVADSFSAYTGRSFSAREIEAVLNRNTLSYTWLDEPAKEAAIRIAGGSIIGWFQGRSEIGARALGNRSILANPAIPGMKDKINHAIKFRESFRPFCPSVLQEDFNNYFSSAITDIPFMNLTVRCKDSAVKHLPAIVHKDKTARAQTVSQKNNPIFHELLTHVKQLTGHGVLLNTSLNVRNHPMAYDVNDVLSAFYTSGLDAVFIENILIEK